MAQTTISANPAVGQSGQLASTAGLVVDSRIADEATLPGIAVSIGASDDTCSLTAGTFLGIALLDPSRTTVTYSAGDVVPFVARGDVWVLTNDAVTDGAAVYALDADGTIQAGSSSATVIPGAIFLTSTGAAGLAKVRLGANK